MSYTGDIKDDPNNSVPLLAKMLYHDYGIGALQLADEAIGKALDFLPELFVNLPPEGRNAFRQVLELERIVKFCHIAENLGAIAVAFKRSFDDEKQEILGIFDAITSYRVNYVVDFYKFIQTRELQYVAKIVGYPILDLQRPGAKKILEISCRNIRDDLAKIGTLYEELRPLYDAYKHGYRLHFGSDNNSHYDVIVYVDIDKDQKVLALPDALKTRIHEKAALAFHIMNTIFESHKARVTFEATGTSQGPIKVTIYRRKTDPRPAAEDMHLIYQTRGERLRKETEEGDKLYEQFREELEKNHMGKIVALDVDSKKIIALDYDLEKVRKEIGTTGRIRIRKVGQDSKSGLDLY